MPPASTFSSKQLPVSVAPLRLNSAAKALCDHTQSVSVQPAKLLMTVGLPLSVMLTNAQRVCVLPLQIGAPLPLTGPLSPEGIKQQRGYDVWAEAVNAKGGIKAGGKSYKVEIVYVDYQSNTPRAVQLAEKLITDDKVDYLFAPFGSGATKAVSAVTEKNEVPNIAATASYGAASWGGADRKSVV